MGKTPGLVISGERNEILNPAPIRVIPGEQRATRNLAVYQWIPAFAGMTSVLFGRGSLSLVMPVQTGIQGLRGWRLVHS